MTCSGKSAGCILIVCGKEGGRGKGEKKKPMGPNPSGNGFIVHLMLGVPCFLMNFIPS